ncbi:glycoside hydrolase family 28 protein [Subtercola lobariae]|uniref:Endopolygalacturonase n=1 Tax=Subtercola lobariae TaxID=1588641 RepID=A0A917B4C6_9MICO|nr:glycosyl hydrolase family 28 protein [Subtercola lobariae]GGF20808.1 endopolygalacturonase [Subtercola lobariae]
MTTTFNIRDFGAVGDGNTNDALAIQTAIDAANANGGGTVLVPAGATFLSGSIVLKSNVELHIERGATLQASGHWADITERHTVSALSSGVVNEETLQSGLFIAAYDATNIAVTGAGTIDGGGRFYVLEDLGPIYLMPVNRPFTLFFIGCSDVTLKDTLYRDGALWTVRLTGCESVLIHSIRIRGDMKLPNADGIDLDRCRDVRISDCDIRCPDDAISLKTCEEFPDLGPCENITVTNCILETKSSALVIGVDATSPIRNVVFDNCVIKNSHRGLSVNLGQDSLYENILFSNIVVETRIYDDSWWGKGEVIYVSAFPWQEAIGRVRNVRFVNILARGENGVHIAANEPGLIEGLLLENVRVEIDHWSEFEGGKYDRRPFSGEEKIYDYPTSAFHIDTASDITVRNCEAVWGDEKQSYYAHAIETINTENVVIEGFRGQSAFPDRLAAIVSH